MLAAHRGAADAAGIDWKSAVYRKAQEEVRADRGLTITRMMELGRLSRSGFYRFNEEAGDRPDRDMDLRDAIQHIAVEWPSYGRPGLVHHSDRGSQYASTDYTDLLKARGIEISMSRKGNPWDNAACESFMKSLKYEEVLRNEYRDLGEARRSIVRFLEQVYNERRLHSALGYQPPVEFERARLTQRHNGQPAGVSSL